MQLLNQKQSTEEKDGIFQLILDLLSGEKIKPSAVLIESEKFKDKPSSNGSNSESVSSMGGEPPPKSARVNAFMNGPQMQDHAWRPEPGPEPQAQVPSRDPPMVLRRHKRGRTLDIS
jgi:hypothetical protein